jgi:hypothetical protein
LHGSKAQAASAASGPLMGIEMVPPSRASLVLASDRIEIDGARILARTPVTGHSLAGRSTDESVPAAGGTVAATTR